jgi:hypothetical protein
MAAESGAKRVYFISGHMVIDRKEWEAFYPEKIDAALKEKPEPDFVLGNAPGVDTLAFDYLLKTKSVDPKRVSIFLHSNRPAKLQADREKCLKAGVNIREGFKTANLRDEALTTSSTHDIAWDRPEAECKAKFGDSFKPGRISGTKQNLLRRQLHPTHSPPFLPAQPTTTHPSTHQTSTLL